jgi:thioredoxin-like negative regulator of GroEL
VSSLLKIGRPIAEPSSFLKESRLANMIKEIGDREFDGMIEKSSVPVLVEFWQPGCGHCRALTQELEHIQEELGERLRIIKMNVQENFLIPGELEIQSLPALALYINGQFEQFIGAIGRKDHILKQLFTWLESHK